MAQQPPPPKTIIPLKRRLLLSSDFDDTLFGPRTDPRHTEASANFARVFSRLRHPLCGSPALLAVNTGRTLPLFAQHPDAEHRLNALDLKPDVLIAGVGTRVYWRRSGQGDDGTASCWLEDETWTAAVAEGWDPALARSAVEQALEACSTTLQEARFQRAEELHDHKLTVSFAGDERGAGALCAEITRRFAALSASRDPPRLVTGPCAKGGRRYVDVLPAAAGKGNAMVFVAGRLGYGAGEVASAGDSHNDRCMLASRQQHRAIVVGNAHPGLRQGLGGSLPHVWLAPEGLLGAAAVLRGLAAAGGWWDGDDEDEAGDG